ncbi:1-acyl-sn-glycerol-3-phosphate acyltransferase [hydrothermal vent metagenome]|uniref:1-acyl-sn-glycerol-3-phosphate acyltransferase n=1 Tax=hydrothermal vent metagenome TaxID=652676 RepID=A0A1W1CEW2_9ZZZZ
MQFIGSIFYALGNYLTLIIVALLIPFIFFMPIKFRYKVLSKWNLFSIWWLKITTGLTFKVIGEENIPNKACVIASNHQSTWETIAFIKIFPQHTWVLKKELLYIPFFGWGLAMLNPISINRKEKTKSIKKIIIQGKDRIKKGLFIVIFPEGTRQPYKKLGKYQLGAMVIASKTNTPVLPVVHNAGKFWTKGNFTKKRGCIEVIIGKAIDTTDKTNKEILKEVEEWSKNQVSKLE